MRTDTAGLVQENIDIDVCASWAASDESRRIVHVTAGMLWASGHHRLQTHDQHGQVRPTFAKALSCPRQRVPITATKREAARCETKPRADTAPRAGKPTRGKPRRARHSARAAPDGSSEHPGINERHGHVKTRKGRTHVVLPFANGRFMRRRSAAAPSRPRYPRTAVTITRRLGSSPSECVVTPSSPTSSRCTMRRS